jgi:tRNA nucleotidyltransferase (CCA-adding enzyme)
MAYTVGSAFSSFRQNTVDLTANDTQKARSSRDYLFDQIKSLAQNNTDFPKLYGDYLSFGSFARKTKIRPLNDVDVLVLRPFKATVQGGGIK